MGKDGAGGYAGAGYGYDEPKTIVKIVNKVVQAPRKENLLMMTNGRVQSYNMQADARPVEILGRASPVDYLPHRRGPSFAELTLGLADMNMTVQLNFDMSVLNRETLTRAMEEGRELTLTIE